MCADRATLKMKHYQNWPNPVIILPFILLLLSILLFSNDLPHFLPESTKTGKENIEKSRCIKFPRAKNEDKCWQKWPLVKAKKEYQNEDDGKG